MWTKTKQKNDIALKREKEKKNRQYPSEIMDGSFIHIHTIGQFFLYK